VFTEPNGTQSPQTYVFAAWFPPGLFPSLPNAQDIAPLSHEISEWMNDPFIDNVVPAWSPPAGQPPCSDLLETGDPINFAPDAFTPITLDGFTYHPQTEALLQWFSRESPSSAFAGAYSFPNTQVATTPATGC
jgi:hypothetical protein